MNEEVKCEVLAMLKQWWIGKHISTEQLKARVVMLFKKGDTSNLSNYRPIALLNAIYKIIASIIQKRLAETLDPKLQKTQYGFRKQKSTSHAIHIIRRIIDMGERKKSDTRTTRNNPTTLLLLDWEKAFDKVSQEGLFEAMSRMNIDEKIIRLTKQLYKNLSFYVEMVGKQSGWKNRKQESDKDAPYHHIFS